MASKIEDYGMIGNTITCALVSRSGSIDWFCAPRFDSDACFTALVGYDEHGRWSVRPAAQVREARQRYRDDSMVLETEFVCDGGVVRVVDFMPMDGRCSIVRVVEGVDGEVPVEMLLDVRFGYGADAPLIEMTREGTRFLAGPDALILRGPLTLQQQGARVSAELQVRKGDHIPIQLTWYPSHEQPPAGVDVSQALAATDAFWREWAGRCTYQGRWRDAVVRSLLTLKAMTYAPTGGIVAAPTTSLPESIGGVRNWDYRYCWLRDASLTLDALLIGGYVDEARAFRDWLVRATAGAPAELQIMYGIDGFRRLTELDLALAARLRGVEAGARRQRGVGAVPARRLRRGHLRPLCGAETRASLESMRAGGSRRMCSRSWRRRGRSPTTASGRCAADGATSPTPRSWPGSPSIGS